MNPGTTLPPFKSLCAYIYISVVTFRSQLLNAQNSFLSLQHESPVAPFGIPTQGDGKMTDTGDRASFKMLANKVMHNCYCNPSIFQTEAILNRRSFKMSISLKIFSCLHRAFLQSHAEGPCAMVAVTAKAMLLFFNLQSQSDL